MTIYDDKLCDRCNTEYRPTGPASRYCPACAPLQRKATQSKAMRKHNAKRAAYERAVKEAVKGFYGNGKLAYRPMFPAAFDALVFDTSTKQYSTFSLETADVHSGRSL